MKNRVSTPRQPDLRFGVPGHPWTTLLFIAANWLIVISTFIHDPIPAFIGVGIAIAGLPIYFSGDRRAMVRPRIKH